MIFSQSEYFLSAKSQNLKKDFEGIMSSSKIIPLSSNLKNQSIAPDIESLHPKFFFLIKKTFF